MQFIRNIRDGLTVMSNQSRETGPVPRDLWIVQLSPDLKIVSNNEYLIDE